ncbi:MAG: hypothetical protein ACRDQ2_12595, partial [Gaiellales bacterium]
MRRCLLLLVAGAALLATQACVADHRAPTDDEVSAQAEFIPSNGEPIKFFFLTHCGVENARIGGHWWHADPPLYGRGGNGMGPPDGWDNPYQEGRLIVESPDRAVFKAKGTTV